MGGGVWFKSSKVQHESGVCNHKMKWNIWRQRRIKCLNTFILAVSHTVRRNEGQFTFSSALFSHQGLILSISPFNIDFASVIFSYKRRNWPDMKLAFSGSPVHVLTSTISRLWSIKLRTEASWLRTNSGAPGMLEKTRRVLATPRGGGRELSRTWTSY